MKKHLFTALLATVAVGGVFAMNANHATNPATKSLAVQNVYPQGSCLTPTPCSNVFNTQTCISGIANYYDVSGCTTLSAFKYRQ